MLPNFSFQAGLFSVSKWARNCREDLDLLRGLWGDAFLIPVINAVFFSIVSQVSDGCFHLSLVFRNLHMTGSGAATSDK